MAEGEGFEPPDLSVCGFQDRRLKPLGHPSASCFLVIVGSGLLVVEIEFPPDAIVSFLGGGKATPV
jgi:hypothetical protein